MRKLTPQQQIELQRKQQRLQEQGERIAQRLQELLPTDYKIVVNPSDPLEWKVLFNLEHIGGFCYYEGWICSSRLTFYKREAKTVKNAVLQAIGQVVLGVSA